MAEAIRIWTAAVEAVESPELSAFTPQLIENLCAHKLLELLLDWYIDNVNDSLKQQAHQFWRLFLDSSVSVAVQQLHETYMKHARIIKFLESTIQSDQRLPFGVQFTSQFQAILLTSAPRDFKRTFLAFFKAGFESWNKQANNNSSSNDDEDDDDEEEEEDSESDGAADSMDVDQTVDQTVDPQDFAAACRHLYDMGWLAVVEDTYTDTLHKAIHSKILKQCTGKYETPFLPKLHRWLDTVVYAYMQVVLCSSVESPSDMFTAWKQRINFYVFEVLTTLRISEMFDIITDYPDSEPVLIDLRECLNNTRKHKDLSSSLVNQFQKRLLIPGANTSDIISLYVSTIRVLRNLDPKGILLESVSEPVKDYLRKRKDTIRCIVTSLTDDSNSELFGELGAGSPSTAEHDDKADLSDDSEDEGDNADHWEPDPVEADPSKTSRSRKSADIISMLVNIYGSKELFVNEYRGMLSERLLASTDYETEKEVRNLELLKLRFGEASLHSCEIMVKDIVESRRINTAIHSASKAEHQRTAEALLPFNRISATIISKQFWPSLPQEEFKMAPSLSSTLTSYAKKYSELKVPRLIQFVNHLGTVTLELEKEGKTVSFTVSPLHASIISYFSEQPSWDLESLAKTLEMSSDALRRRISFWVTKSVLKETRTDTRITYDLILNTPEGEGSSGFGGGGEFEGHPMEEEDSISDISNYKSVEMYVIGMLNNFPSLPAEKIHNMLTMFAMDPPYQFTMTQLQAFLAKLVSNDKLESPSPGVFKLKS
eukprot:GILK01007736.1.p1 GENE.GILK01007736.1~~GILK01007736.1.p1  ORF type:complete len:769 (+),score=156.85 GILK01007736.1:51-2357(+)